MSKHGVTRKKLIKKQQTKQQHSTPTPVIQSIVSLEEALTNPEQSGLPPEVSAIFSQIKTLEARSIEFINAAKLHSKPKRDESLNSFFLRNKDFIRLNIKSLINTIEIYFRQKHEVPYALITQRLQQIQMGQIESDHDKQIELLNKKIREAEHLFLLGYEKVNVWQTVLTLLEKYDEKRLNLRQKSMMNMFVDLTQSTSYLINYFILCKLSTVNYYDCYVYLQEKAEWLICYAEEYQIYLQTQPCEEVSDKQVAWKKNCELLQCYQSIASFLYSCKLDKQAGTIHKIAQSFLKESYEYRDRFISSELSIEVIDGIYKWHHDKYEHIDQIAETVLDNTWLPFLGTLSFFYERDWMSTSGQPFTDPTFYDIEYICQAVNECKSAIEKEEEEKEAILPLTMQFRNALALFSQYKTIPNELKNPTLIQTHFSLALTLYKAAKSRTLDNIFYHQIIVALFKKLADGLGNDFKNVLPTKKQESQTQSPSSSKSFSPQLEKIETEDDTEFNHFIESVADQLSDLVLDTVETSLPQEAKEERNAYCEPETSNHSSAPLKHEEKLPSTEQDIASEPHIIALMHNHDIELKAAEEAHHHSLVSLRTEHEQKLLAETKKIDALHEENKAKMHQLHQKEKNQLSLSLAHDYQKHIQSLTLQHKNVLASEQETHEKNFEKFKTRKKKQYDKKIETLQKKHEQEIQSFKEIHSQMTIEVQVRHQKDISSQEAKFELELKTIKQQLEVTQNKAISKAKITHEQKLKSMHENHHLTIQTLTKSNATTIKMHQEKFEQHLHKETSALQQRFASELSRLRSEHEKNIQCIIENHEKTIHELEVTYHEKHKKTIEIERKKQEIQISSLQNSQRATFSEREQELSTPQRPATDGLIPFANIILPPETIYILKELKTVGIEYYFAGGFVRNRLLGIPLSPHEDIDIIVNCQASDLPPGIKSGFSHEVLESRKLKLGKIDLWCEPWHKLEDKLKQRDLSINTFICKDNGAVYDLLDKKQDLHSTCLIMLGDIEERFEHDPSLMMRFIRFSQQLGKSISTHDWKILRKHAEKIKNLNIGIYLKNIEYLFVSTYATQNLELILTGHIFHQVCPLLNMTNILILYQNPMLFSFVNQKLHEFSLAQENYNYYHILAVFSLIPMLQLTSASSFQEKLEHCLNNFFTNYTGSCELAERNKIQKIVASLMFDATRHSKDHEYQVMGILSQYKQYTEYYSYQNQRQQQPQPLNASTSIEITQSVFEEKAAFIPMSSYSAQSERQNRNAKKKDHSQFGCGTDRKKGNYL